MVLLLYGYMVIRLYGLTVLLLYGYTVIGWYGYTVILHFIGYIYGMRIPIIDNNVIDLTYLSSKLVNIRNHNKLIKYKC